MFHQFIESFGADSALIGLGLLGGLFIGVWVGLLIGFSRGYNFGLRDRQAVLTPDQCRAGALL